VPGYKSSLSSNIIAFGEFFAQTAALHDHRNSPAI